MTPRAWSLSLVLLAAACAKEPQLDPQMPGPPEPVEAKPQEPELAPGTIRRAELDLVLKEGPAWLLRRVPIDEVMANGKFVGWRVRELPAEWTGVDLRPGDVITKVNAMPVETPNDFWAAWTTLSVASELKIDYQRSGEDKVLSLAVVGQPDPSLSSSMKKEPPPPEQRPRDKRFQTIVIPGESSGFEPSVDFSK